MIGGYEYENEKLYYLGYYMGYVRKMVGYEHSVNKI